MEAAIKITITDLTTKSALKKRLHNEKSVLPPKPTIWDALDIAASITICLDFSRKFWKLLEVSGKFLGNPSEITDKYNKFLKIQGHAQDCRMLSLVRSESFKR